MFSPAQVIVFKSGFGGREKQTFYFLLWFWFLQEALNTIQICKEDQDHAFEMLAAVLWLGNISFHVVDNENHVEVVLDEGKNPKCSI